MVVSEEEDRYQPRKPTMLGCPDRPHFIEGLCQTPFSLSTYLLRYNP